MRIPSFQLTDSYSRRARGFAKEAREERDDAAGRNAAVRGEKGAGMHGEEERESGETFYSGISNGAAAKSLCNFLSAGESARTRARGMREGAYGVLSVAT